MEDILLDHRVSPVLKWVGGKRELVPKIREYYKFLNLKKYIEPFFGGGAVYFDILNTLNTNIKETSIINDINTDFIEMYRNIKLNPKDIIYNCKELEKDYYKFGYYHIRDKFNGIDKNNNKLEKYNSIVR